MPKVAIINTAEETLDMLRELLGDEGFSLVSAYVVDFKRGEQDLGRFFREHQPEAILCDVALPYEENWDFCVNRILPASQLSPQNVVFTSTNKAVLERLVGPTGAIEIIGKPYDLDEIVRAVWRAVRGEQFSPL